MKRKNEPIELTGETFDALSDSEKERIFQELEQESPQERLKHSKPLTAAERARWQRIKREFKRTKTPKANGIRKISVGLESTFLKRVDAYAKDAGLTRAQLIARAQGTARVSRLKQRIGSGEVNRIASLKAPLT